MKSIQIRPPSSLSLLACSMLPSSAVICDIRGLASGSCAQHLFNRGFTGTGCSKPRCSSTLGSCAFAIRVTSSKGDFTSAKGISLVMTWVNKVKDRHRAQRADGPPPKPTFPKPIRHSQPPFRCPSKVRGCTTLWNSSNFRWYRAPHGLPMTQLERDQSHR